MSTGTLISTESLKTSFENFLLNYSKEEVLPAWVIVNTIVNFVTDNPDYRYAAPEVKNQLAREKAASYSKKELPELLVLFLLQEKYDFLALTFSDVYALWRATKNKLFNS